MAQPTPTSSIWKKRDFYWRVVASRWVGAALVAILLVCTLAWFATRPKVPDQIRIATGAIHGQYFLCGELLKETLLSRIDSSSLTVLETKGSVDNAKLLRSREAELAIVQNGAISMAGLVVIAPLYHDVVHVVVRKERGAKNMLDLVGANVALGPIGSGMRATGSEIFGHYGMDAESSGADSTSYFGELASNRQLDAAIVTTGFRNVDLRELLSTAEYQLVDIHDRDAIATMHPHFTPTEIPRGLYRGNPPVPATAKKSLATTAMLVARDDVADALVKQVVAALYEDYPHLDPRGAQRQAARLLREDAAAAWRRLPLHPVTQTYFEPYEGLLVLKDFMESMVATKDLLFTLGAGVYVLWLWRRKVIQQKNAAALAIHMRRLEVLLDETIRIEGEQMHTEDPQKLRDYLDEVTQIKLRALDELTDKDLRGDQMFAIFLAQCSNLSRKLQLRISLPGSQ